MGGLAPPDCWRTGRPETRARAITAMHDAPQTAWSLEALAAQAGMSRRASPPRSKTRWASRRATILADWRMNVSCTLLRQGVRWRWWLTASLRHGNQGIAILENSSEILFLIAYHLNEFR